MAKFSAPLSIFPVKEKTNEKAPDFTGTVEIPTAELQDVINYLSNADHEMNWKDEAVIKLRVSAWSNEAKDGRRYLKGSLQPPYKPEAVASPATPASAELPF
jgi:uncharacterized protein (DUF736 family)